MNKVHVALFEILLLALAPNPLWSEEPVGTDLHRSQHFRRTTYGELAQVMARNKVVFCHITTSGDLL